MKRNKKEKGGSAADSSAAEDRNRASKSQSIAVVSDSDTSHDASSASRKSTSPPEPQEITRTIPNHDKDGAGRLSASGTRSSSSHDQEKSTGFGESRDDIEDVVRSGIVSRLLASVSGGGSDAAASPTSALRTPPTPETTAKNGSNTSSKADIPPTTKTHLKTASTHSYTSETHSSDKNKLPAVSLAKKQMASSTGSTPTPNDPPISGRTSKDTSGLVGNVSSSITAPVPNSNKSYYSHNTTTNQNSSNLSKSVTEDKQTVPSGGSLSPSRAIASSSLRGDVPRGERKSISVVDITRESKGGVGGVGKATKENNPKDGTSSNSSKSKKLSNLQGHINSPYAGDNVHPSDGARETIVRDFPQSISADSGIGSPTDAGLSIDPSGGGEMDGRKEGKWKGEITAVGSSGTQIVAPHLPNRSDNYRPCKEPGDVPSVPSSSDTSNYLSGSKTTGPQPFHASQLGKHKSNPESSSIGDGKGNPKSQTETRNGVKGANLKTSITSESSSNSQNATNLDQNETGLSGEQSLPVNTQISGGADTKGRHSQEKEVVKNSSMIEGEEASSVIQTLHTTEFTIENETSDSKASNTIDAKSVVSVNNKDQNTLSKVNNSEGTDNISHQEGVLDGTQEKSSATNESLQRTPNHIDSGTDNDENSLKQNEDVTSPEVGGAEKKGAVLFYEDEENSSDSDKKSTENSSKKKPKFRDINLQEVIALSDSPESGRKIKGILKTKSAPALGKDKEASEEIETTVNGVAKDDLAASRSVSFKKTHTKNTFSYYNAAFEGEIITEPSKRPSLADVVNHIMRQNSIIELEDDNSHPYGRDSSLTDLMTGKRRDNYNMDAGKMIVWLALAIMIVSLAGGIIFMSETYNLNHKDETIEIQPSYDATTQKLPS